VLQCIIVVLSQHFPQLTPLEPSVAPTTVTHGLLGLGIIKGEHTPSVLGLALLLGDSQLTLDS
jgi:hypothetical protein